MYQFRIMRSGIMEQQMAKSKTEVPNHLVISAPSIDMQTACGYKTTIYWVDVDAQINCKRCLRMIGMN